MLNLSPLRADKEEKVMLTHNCGIFGVFGNISNALSLAYYGLLQLQHRGQEGAGLVASTPEGFREWKGEGLLEYAIPEKKIKLIESSTAALGHLRYSTIGAPSLENIQPFVTEFNLQPLALAHNGSLVNFEPIKQELIASGTIFHSSTDSELILHLIAHSGKRNLIKALLPVLERIEGAYSLLILTPDELLAIRDPYGFRPLEYGQLPGAHLFASESSAFSIIGGRRQKSIGRGKIVRVAKNSVEEFNFGEGLAESFCLFELIYFARPDSIINDYDVYQVRCELGALLARVAPVEADIIIAVPDSSNTAALAYANALNLPFGFGFVRNHYVGRSFINPSLRATVRDVNLKYSTIRSSVYGKRVCVVDDSIVRGVTSKRLVSLLFEAGAREVHLRVASPPLRFPCFYGIDIPSAYELIASHFDDVQPERQVEKIRKYLGATTLAYTPLEGILSLPSLRGSENSTGRGFCTACFSGNYPIAVKGRKP